MTQTRQQIKKNLRLPLQLLALPSNDREHVCELLHSALRDTFRISTDQIDVVSRVILMQAEMTSDKQFPFLSQAILSVISSYRNCIDGHPGYGFQLLFAMDTIGLTTRKVRTSILFIQDFYEWVDEMVPGHGRQEIDVPRENRFSTEMVLYLSSLGLLQEGASPLYFSVRRDRWVFELSKGFLFWIGEYWTRRSDLFSDVSLTTVLVSQALEVLSILFVREQDARLEREKKGEALLEFDAYGLIDRYAEDCFHLVFLQRKLRMNHRFVGLLLYHMADEMIPDIKESLERQLLTDAIGDCLTERLDIWAEWRAGVLLECLLQWEQQTNVSFESFLVAFHRYWKRQHASVEAATRALHDAGLSI